jgi:hypothetical protein
VFPSTRHLLCAWHSAAEHHQGRRRAAPRAT